MGYIPRKTVYRLTREQLHLNKAKLQRSKFSYLDQYESCLAYQPFVSSCRFYLLRATGQNIRYSGVNCALGPSKSIRYSGDFVIAGFVITGFVSTYFTVILPGFQILFVIAEFVIVGFVIAGFVSTYFTVMLPSLWRSSL